jgi:trehalose 6-phosphate synthase/phosphatase
MRLIIVSNRPPVKIFRENGTLGYRAAAGGLATGLRSYIEHQKAAESSEEILWIGWPGGEVEEQERPKTTAELRSRFGVEPAYVSDEMMDRFYLGFCNNTIWPLFHYFPSLVKYDVINWQDYFAVNRIFANAVVAHYKPGDRIWVHDYHLMLLPAMLRGRLPDAEIGFFLHIPFPSHEVFRLLPLQWRQRILDGLMGADLIGFHTPEYTSHFLESAEQVLPITQKEGVIRYQNRELRAAAFPMGIEFSRFHEAALLPEVEHESLLLRQHVGKSKVILSVDRQDYTKGILNRLDGYEYFLEHHPEWRGKTIMMMVVVPSRIGVEDYQAVKGRIDKAVGKINGEFSRLGWAPIVYQYRELEFEELMALYTCSNVALVTPLRDGMNLIAKEYVAARRNLTGVLILSEMAGAVDELQDSIIVNPNFKEQIGEALAAGLDMPLEEQRRRMTVMQALVKDYDVIHWAADFLSSLTDIRARQTDLVTLPLKGSALSWMIAAFKRARSRLLLLDYDGTLTPIVSDPRAAVPSEKLLATLARLAGIRRTEVAIVSGRDRATMEQWFGDLPISLIAEHGAFIRRWPKRDRWLRGIRRVIPPQWKKTPLASDIWKPAVRNVMEDAARSLNGAWVEEKEYSIAFHFRGANAPDTPERVRALVEHLNAVADGQKLHIVEGKKIVEARMAAIDKGFATRPWLGKGLRPPGFVLAIGDDTTDEDLFAAMPNTAYTIKVGHHPSMAAFSLDSPIEVLELLRGLATSKIPALP